MDNQTLHLWVRANEDVFTPERVEHPHDNAPAGEPVTRPVPATIIGYWVDIKDCNNRVVYRRFLHHLPHNLACTWQSWSTRKRKNANYLIDLPKLENAYKIELYEQKLESQSAKLPTRHCHFSLDINHSAQVQNYCQSA